MVSALPTLVAIAAFSTHSLGRPLPPTGDNYGSYSFPKLGYFPDVGTVGNGLSEGVNFDLIGKLAFKGPEFGVSREDGLRMFQEALLQAYVVVDALKDKLNMYSI